MGNCHAMSFYYFFASELPKYFQFIKLHINNLPNQLKLSHRFRTSPSLIKCSCQKPQ